MWLSYLVVKLFRKNSNVITVPKRHGRTDGRTERQTDRQTDDMRSHSRALR